MSHSARLYETSPLAQAHGAALLISAAFPPAAEAGAARWEGFAPFLADAGWSLDVVMEHPDTLAIVDWERVKRLPRGIRVSAVRRAHPSWFRALLTANRLMQRRDAGAVAPVSSSVAAGDGAAAEATARSLRSRLIERAQVQRDRGWIAGAVRAAMSICNESHRLVISSGPPHDAHVAAAEVARRTGLPHIVDLRDPWVNPRGHADDGGSAVVDLDLVHFEAATLNAAALIVTNTIPMGEKLATRYPALESRIVAIPNGSDLAPRPVPARKAGERFVVAHAGALYLDRDPRPLLRAIARLKQAGTIDESTFRIVFMGGHVIVAGRPIEAWAAEYGVQDVFEFRERGSRDEARQLLQDAAVAVAFQGQTTTQIPAKVFEYVAFPLWLFALVGTTSATGQLLAGSDAVVLAIDDEAGIASELERCFHQFHQHGRPEPVGVDGRYSRERQASRLLSLLERFHAGRNSGRG